MQMKAILLAAATVLLSHSGGAFASSQSPVDPERFVDEPLCPMHAALALSPNPPQQDIDRAREGCVARYGWNAAETDQALLVSRIGLEVRDLRREVDEAGVDPEAIRRAWQSLTAAEDRILEQLQNPASQQAQPILMRIASMLRADGVGQEHIAISTRSVLLLAATVREVSKFLEMRVERARAAQ